MSHQFRAGRAAKALRQFCAWLANSGYKPERHYMRGDRRRGQALAAEDAA